MMLPLLWKQREDFFSLHLRSLPRTNRAPRKRRRERGLFLDRVCPHAGLVFFLARFFQERALPCTLPYSCPRIPANPKWKRGGGRIREMSARGNAQNETGYSRRDIQRMYKSKDILDLVRKTLSSNSYSNS